MVVALPTSGSVTLGRSEECEIRIDSRSVSRRHAILHLGPPLCIQDLGSANGTFVRDARSPLDTAATQPLRKLSREVFELAVGERLSLGTVPLAVRRKEEASHSSAPTAAVVRDPAMLAIHDQLGRAARSTLSILLLGETGVGKEVLARAVHDRSPRAPRPFMELNCAALPPSLLEGELFGYEKNAFTGAAAARPGLLEAADGGTVFLDEIGELPLPVQIKLLRVLEDRKVLRLGGRTPRTLDVRFVAATNRDLPTEVAEKRFRHDLYFRLDGITLLIPPLRERRDRIGVLAVDLFSQACARAGRSAHLTLDALDVLAKYDWPGNVRELRAVLERSLLLSRGGEVASRHLAFTPAVESKPVISGPLASVSHGAQALAPSQQQASSQPPAPSGGEGDSNLQADEPWLAMLSAEQRRDREQIIATLESCAGNQTRAAKQLGISRTTLVNRIQIYRIPRPRS